ncbi:MAG: sigma-54-dependent Fis family transcriptional regulator [Magnetospirillum gryphiswaldense]|nr:sigma-54-dependent Fis family transcriptional regulator [Magnetospirillum gryphiswaldense]
MKDANALPTILVIDERLSRERDARTQFLKETGLVEVQGAESGDARANPAGFAEFCSGPGQNGDGWSNDYEAIRRVVTNGSDCVDKWSLILLNASFRTQAATGRSTAKDHDIGHEIYRRLAKDVPGAPIIMFTSRHQKDLIDEVGNRYLHKKDLSQRQINEALLTHGRLTPAQKRKILGLGQTTVAEADLTFDVLSAAYVHADEDSPIMLLGESGVGKEVVARYIHQVSHRSGGQFIGFNAAAIPKDLAESELFGHEKGSFSGATQRRKGVFELAHNGTLFLDEVGDMALDLQVKLLRALQEQKFRRLGAMEETEVSVRLVCATSRDLRAGVRDGTFREDLYFRLSAVPIDIPPLRKRQDDIAPLAKEFLRYYQEKQGKSGIEFSDAALTALCRHPFYGNVRELGLLVQRLVGKTGNCRLLSASDIAKEFEIGGVITPHQKAVADIPQGQPGAVPSLPAADSVPPRNISQLIEFIETFQVRAEKPELEAVLPQLEQAQQNLLYRLATAAFGYYEREAGKSNVTAAMSLLAGQRLDGAQAKRLNDKIRADAEIE